MGRTHIGEVCGELSAVRGGKSVRSLPSEEEGAAETMCDELTTTPIPRPLCHFGGGESGETRVKLSLGRREG